MRRVTAALTLLDDMADDRFTIQTAEILAMLDADQTHEGASDAAGRLRGVRASRSRRPSLKLITSAGS
jgi:hypothetical protein